MKFALTAAVLSLLLGAARSLDGQADAAYHAALNHSRHTLAEVGGPIQATAVSINGDILDQDLSAKQRKP